MIWFPIWFLAGVVVGAVGISLLGTWRYRVLKRRADAFARANGMPTAEEVTESLRRALAIKRAIEAGGPLPEGVHHHQRIVSDFAPGADKEVPKA